MIGELQNVPTKLHACVRPDAKKGTPPPSPGPFRRPDEPGSLEKTEQDILFFIRTHPKDGRNLSPQVSVGSL